MNGLDGDRRIRTCFEQGKIREYWESDSEFRRMLYSRVSPVYRE